MTGMKKVSFMSAGNIFNAVLGFIFLAAVAKRLPVDEFGKYAVLTSLLTLIARVMDFGTNSIYVAEAIINKRDINKFVSLKLFLFLITIPLAVIALSFFKLLQTPIFLLFLLGLIAYGFDFTLYAIFQSHQDFIKLFTIHFVPAVIKGISAVLLLANIIKPNLTATFAVFSFSILTSVLFSIFVREKIELNKIGLDFEYIKKHITKAVSAGISQLIYEGWPTINNAVTKMYKGFFDIGVFSLANKISNIFTLLSLSIFTVLLPKNAHLKRQNQKYDFRETFMLGGAITLISILIILMSSLFINVVFGNKFASSIEILNILIVAAALNAIQNFTENYFFVEGSSKYLGFINGTKLITLLATSSIMMATWGITGLALANVIVSALGLGVTVNLIRLIENGRLK